MELRIGTMFCHKVDPTTNHGYPYRHFMQSRRACELGYGKGDIVMVTLEECEEHEGCYFAWWENDKASYTLAYPKRFLVDMCFTYGSQAETDRGRGFLLPVNVREVKNFI